MAWLTFYCHQEISIVITINLATPGNKGFPQGELSLYLHTVDATVSVIILVAVAAGVAPPCPGRLYSVGRSVGRSVG